MEKTTIILDSTQLVNFLTCPTFWNLHDREHYGRIDSTERAATLMGTLGHKYLELYYKGLALGKSEAVARDSALEYDYRAEYNEKNEEYPLKKEDIDIVQSSFEDYVTIYGFTGRDFRVENPEYVEVGFSEKIFEDEFCLFILEGKIDIFRAMLNGQEITVDHKFQMLKRDLYRKSIQFRNYAMVGKSRLLLINYIRLTKKRDNTTYARDISAFDPNIEHDLWRQEVLGMFHSVYAYTFFIKQFKDEWSPGYKNRSSCQGKWGNCIYTELCDETHPQIRQSKLDTLFQIKKEWKPWD